MALIANFREDTTYQLPTKIGDVLVWTRIEDIFGGGEVHVQDMWQLRDGDVVLMTNRPSDFPPWFTLHPTEVSGDRAVYEMTKKLESGWQPGEILTVPTSGGFGLEIV